ncbi:hypothetical protein [Pectobacterium brasiliense]
MDSIKPEHIRKYMDKRWCEKQNAGEQAKGIYVKSFPAVGDQNKNSR